MIVSSSDRPFTYRMTSNLCRLPGRGCTRRAGTAWRSSSTRPWPQPRPCRPRSACEPRTGLEPTHGQRGTWVIKAVGADWVPLSSSLTVMWMGCNMAKCQRILVSDSLSIDRLFQRGPSRFHVSMSLAGPSKKGLSVSVIFILWKSLTKEHFWVNQLIWWVITQFVLQKMAQPT